MQDVESRERLIAEVRPAHDRLLDHRPDDGRPARDAGLDHGRPVPALVPGEDVARHPQAHHQQERPDGQPPVDLARGPVGTDQHQAEQEQAAQGHRRERAWRCKPRMNHPSSIPWLM